MRNRFLSFSPPLIADEEIDEVVDTLHSDWITTGPKVRRFEEAFAAFVGASGALALNSCTGALHVALAALGIGPGDVVITTPMTFCSSVHVIEHVGARPLLVDVEPDTLNIDPAQVQEQVQEAANGRVKAILPVHLYGHPCEMQTLLDVAQNYDLAIVEDAAHALPAVYKDWLIGSSAYSRETLESTAAHVLTCFSFYATKNLTTAEGGMLTGSPKLLDDARIWSLHGMSRDAYKRYSSEGSWYYEVVRPGFKYNMTDIQAAIGLHQLSKLPRFQARRQEIARRYNAAFSQFEELQTPTVRSEVEPAWHLYVLRLHPERLQIGRNQFIEELKARYIGTSVHFIPIHLHPYYRDKYGYKPDDYPVAYQEYQRLISLPLYPRMSDQDVEDVVEAVSEVVKQCRKPRYSGNAPRTKIMGR
jgi:dTDP-4-amino-4,6-dideoxygalactose transaminase